MGRAASRILWIALVACAALAAAEPPALVNYQGVVLAPSGSPRVGPVDLELRIFDAPSGGTELYRETHAAVPLVDGVFSVAIGSGAQQVPPGGFSANLFSAAGGRWLEIRVNGEVVQPRQQFLAVPYALGAAQAAQVAGLTPAQIAGLPGPISGYQRASATAQNSALVVAACAPGRVVVGGGCDCTGTTVDSRPVESSNSWRCECSTATSANRAWALCTQAAAGTCGDGLLDPGEQCDSANVSQCPDQRCAEGCVCSCGNGVVDAGEQCDGANTAACTLSGCAANCQCRCGNGVIDAGEQCDGASAASCPTGICQSSCTCQCGNGICDRPGINAGNEDSTSCPQDCRRPYSRCTSDSQCDGFGAHCWDGYCTRNCAYLETCDLDSLFDEFCSAGVASGGQCIARCTPFDLFGNIIYRCPNDLTCSSPSGGNCIAP